MSLPNLPTKKRKGQLDVESDHASPSIDSPAAETPAPEPEPTPVPAAEPEPLPSLAHIPFPPPPLRPKERNYGPKRFWYTDPRQKPAQAPKHDGRLQPVLDAYIHIEDTGPPADPNALHIRALNEAYYRNRVNYLQHQGRLSRLLEDDTVASSSKTKLPALPARQVDFRDSLMSHMVQVRTAMMNESKSKPVVCKRIARMVLAYWEHVEGKEERERLAEERDRKKKAKDLVRAVRKRWALAVKVIVTYCD
jgi:helicase SWR1